MGEYAHRRTLENIARSLHLLRMRKSMNPSGRHPQSPSKAVVRVTKIKPTKKGGAVSIETGSFKIRTSKSGGMVVGRNATTGAFVIAPAIKAGSAFKKKKTNVVKEVIKHRQEK